MKAVNESWEQLAVELGHRVRSSVNTPQMIGTDDETGYILMFFNAQNHQGKSTLISSATDLAELKKLLKTAIRNLDSPKLKFIDDPGKAN